MNASVPHSKNERKEEAKAIASQVEYFRTERNICVYRTYFRMKRREQEAQHIIEHVYFFQKKKPFHNSLYAFERRNISASAIDFGTKGGVDKCFSACTLCQAISR
jgi:hypothetical protein